MLTQNANHQHRRFLTDKSITPHAVATLAGHSSLVNVLTVLPDGRLASGSWDNTIKLWEMLSGRCMATLAGHSNWVNALTVLPDGRLASGSKDKTIKLWEVLSGRCMATLAGHSDIVTALTVLPDGRLASGSDDKTIKLWEVLSGRCMATLAGHSWSVCALTVLPDGRLTSGSGDNTIKLWEVLSGRCMATLEGHSHYVTALTVLPDGRLASGSWDKTIKLWEVLSGRCMATLEGHSNYVMALTVLPDGRLASGSWDKTIKLWEVLSGRCMATLEGHSDCVHALTVLPDGRLASGSSDDTIKLWDVGARPALYRGALSQNALSSRYAHRGTPLPTGRSFIRQWVNIGYHFDRTVSWVHELRLWYRNRAGLNHSFAITDAHKTLDFDQYFVNLALIDDIAHQQAEKVLREGEGAAQLALDRGDIYQEIFVQRQYFAIEALFPKLDQRRIPTGWVCIIGRAGTGKTTLMQYLTYRWAQKDPLWDNRFDVVFQVKLNLLTPSFLDKLNGSVLEQLIDVITASLAHSEKIPRSFIRVFLTRRKHQTLILLDGFDEIANRWSDLKYLIEYALTELPNGILTTRPLDLNHYWPNQKAFSQLIENVGLSEANVDAYVTKYFTPSPTMGADSAATMPETEIVHSLKQALTENVTLMRLAQIPVNTNALCALWKARQHLKQAAKDGASDAEQFRTRTRLYHQVVLAVIRHAKQKAQPDSHRLALTEDKLRQEYQVPLRQLAALAYHAFEHGQTQTIRASLIEECFKQEHGEELLRLFAEQWGFLREIGQKDPDQVCADHYFVHLTYQEYFTALYFAQALLPRPEGEDETPKEKLVRHVQIRRLCDQIVEKRLDRRYQIIWTFLAGLLSLAPYHDYADYYWDALLPDLPDDALTTVGLHPSMALLTTYYPIIQEALFTCQDKEKSPKRLQTVSKRMVAVMHWQALCQDPVLLALGDPYSDSPQQMRHKRERYVRRQDHYAQDAVKWRTTRLTTTLPWETLLNTTTPLLPTIPQEIPIPEALNTAVIKQNPSTPKDQWSRYQTLLQLCQTPLPESTTPLQRLVDDTAQWEGVRAAAYMALIMQTRRTEADPQTLLQRPLKGDLPAEVRRAKVLATEQLFVTANPEQRSELLSALHTALMDPDEQVQLAAAKALVLTAKDVTGFRALVKLMRSIDRDVCIEALFCVKENAAMITPAVSDVLVALLSPEVTNNDSERQVILRRVRPEVYAALDFNVHPEAMVPYVQSLWLHSEGVYTDEIGLLEAQANFMRQLADTAEIADIAATLASPLPLPRQTKVFDPSFIDKRQLPAEVTLEQVLQTVLMMGGYLREDHQQLRQEIARLLSPLMALKEKVSALEVQCVDQDSRAIKLTGDIGTLNQQIRQLEQRLDGKLSEAEFDQEMTRINDLLTTVEKRLAILTDLTARIAALETQCAEQDRQLIAGKGNLGELKQQMKHLEQRLDGKLSEAEFDQEIEKINALLVQQEQLIKSTSITQAGMYRPAQHTQRMPAVDNLKNGY